MTAATFSAYCKIVQGENKPADLDAACAQLTLIAGLLGVAQLGIADEPAEVRPKVAYAVRALTVCLLRVGLMAPDKVIPPMKWQHRPAEISRAAWLESTSRLITHAEVVTKQTLNTFAGRTPIKGSAVVLMTRLSAVIDDLLALCGALKLSLRECVENEVAVRSSDWIADQSRMGGRHE